MAWHRRSKLGCDMFQNLALGSKHRPIMNCAKVLTCCFHVDGLMNNEYVAVGLAATLTATTTATATVYLSKLETIPYSKRSHFLLVSRQYEKALAGRVLEIVKEEYEGKLLPATHPTSVRVGLIAKNLIDTLQRDLRGENHNVNVWGNWRSGNELRATRYLEHADWEVLVVDDPNFKYACTYGGGKIAVFTGLLEDLNSDAEIATVIAHEVAHTVARHVAETQTRRARVDFDKRFGQSAMNNNIFSLFGYSPLRTKFELEADYIGLILMASAGYDPRVGVKLMEKQVQYLDSAGYDHLYPSAEKRVQLLSQAQDEAMRFYKSSLSTIN